MSLFRIVMLILLLAVSTSPVFSSCVCVNPEILPDKGAGGHAAVFEALADSVIRDSQALHDGSTAYSRKTLLRVPRVLKGSPGETVILEWSECSFLFEAGRHYLVFAEAKDGKFFVRNCSALPMENASSMVRFFEQSTGGLCGTIRGPDGEPAAGAEVAVWKPPEREDIVTSFSTIAGADGTYRLGLLPPGNYPLMAIDRSENPRNRLIGYYGKKFANASGSGPVEIEAGKETCDIDIKLFRDSLLTIRGRVLPEDGSVMDMARCQVTLNYVLSGHPLSVFLHSQVAADGSFVMEGAPKGRNITRAFCPPTNEEPVGWVARGVWVNGIKDRDDVVIPVHRIPERPGIIRE